MSSNFHIKRVCEHCGKPFLARTTVTRFCSHKCNSKAYKAQKAKMKIEASNQETKNAITNPGPSITTPAQPKEILNIKELSAVTGLSERTLFRLIKDEAFPQIRLGRRLMFHKQTVMDYFSKKYGTV